MNSKNNLINDYLKLEQYINSIEQLIILVKTKICDIANRELNESSNGYTHGLECIYKGIRNNENILTPLKTLSLDFTVQCDIFLDKFAKYICQRFVSDIDHLPWTFPTFQTNISDYSKHIHILFKNDHIQNDIKECLDNLLNCDVLKVLSGNNIAGEYKHTLSTFKIVIPDPDSIYNFTYDIEIYSGKNTLILSDTLKLYKELIEEIKKSFLKVNDLISNYEKIFYLYEVIPSPYFNHTGRGSNKSLSINFISETYGIVYDETIELARLIKYKFDLIKDNNNGYGLIQKSHKFVFNNISCHNGPFIMFEYNLIFNGIEYFVNEHDILFQQYDNFILGYIHSNKVSGRIIDGKLINGSKINTLIMHKSNKDISIGSIINGTIAIDNMLNGNTINGRVIDGKIIDEKDIIKQSEYFGKLYKYFELLHKCYNEKNYLEFYKYHTEKVGPIECDHIVSFYDKVRDDKIFEILDEHDDNLETIYKLFKLDTTKGDELLKYCDNGNKQINIELLLNNTHNNKNICNNTNNKEYVNKFIFCYLSTSQFTVGDLLKFSKRDMYKINFIDELVSKYESNIPMDELVKLILF